MPVSDTRYCIIFIGFRAGKWQRMRDPLAHARSSSRLSRLMVSSQLFQRLLREPFFLVTRAPPPSTLPERQGLSRRIGASQPRKSAAHAPAPSRNRVAAPIGSCRRQAASARCDCATACSLQPGAGTRDHGLHCPVVSHRHQCFSGISPNGVTTRR